MWRFANIVAHNGEIKGQRNCLIQGAHCIFLWNFLAFNVHKFFGLHLLTSHIKQVGSVGIWTPHLHIKVQPLTLHNFFNKQ